MVIDDSALSAAPSRAAGRSRAPEVAAEVAPYDFGRAVSLSRESLHALEVRFEGFARQWAGQLSSNVRGHAHVSLEDVVMLGFDEYARELPASTTLVVCALPDSDARFVVQFPLSAAVAWIVPMLGGRVTPTPEDRVLTAIEQALVRTLMTETLGHLAHALDGILPAVPVVVGIQYSPHFAQVAAADAPVVVARMSARLAGRTLPMTLMLPASLVRAGLTSTGAGTQPADPALLRRQIEQSPVELALRLAPRTVRPDDVLELSVGDLLPLPHGADRPLDLVVGDQVVATAAVGSAGARLACVVTATAPDPAEESA